MPRHGEVAQMSESRLYDLLERLGTLLRGEQRRSGQAHGLQPVHMEALHYLARANRYSDTPAGVTEYLGLTKGTVSQTLRLLERKAYVERQADDDDGRRVHFQVSARGRAVLRNAVPPDVFVDAVLALPGETGQQLSRQLEALLRRMLRQRGHRSFGVCRTCRHFRRETGGYRCGLTQEPLSERDSGLICREHERKRSEA